MKLNLQETSIHCSPHAFIDKSGCPVLVKILDPGREHDLLEMYLKYEPKNSVNGLPPEQEGACVMWVKNMLENGINLAALSFDHGIIGHAAVFPMGVDRCEYFVFISQDHQSKGIGTALTRNAIHLAYELGFEKIWLTVEPTNQRARHVYRKCGFQYLTHSEIDDVEMSFSVSRYHQCLDEKVSVIVNRSAVAISPDISCADAAQFSLDGHICSLPVVDDDKNLIGILTATDLITSANPKQKVRDILTRGVVTLGESSPISKAVRLLKAKHLRCIPVLDRKQRFIGVVGRREVLFYYQKTVWSNEGEM